MVPGERVGVVGHNGAGKSTLLRPVLRLWDRDRGRALVDGRDLKEYTIDSLRQQISVVFQDSVFFGMTVRENIALDRVLVLNEGQLCFVGTPEEYGAWLAHQMAGSTAVGVENLSRAKEG
jgi:ABC-type bacteriocin/lantibiotic exporter with double-glycine peptidase domain